MTVYAQLWRIPGAPRLLIAGTVARLGYGITIVAWVLLVEAASGSFSRAGSVAGALSLATAAAAPVLGRLADRHTARRLLPWCTVVYVGSQTTLLWAVLTDLPTPHLVVIAALSGAFFPPVTPALRAAWTRLTAVDGPHAGLRTAAMAAESTVFELVFVVGPLLLSASVLGVVGLLDGTEVGGIATAIGLAGICTLLGTLAVCAGPVLSAERSTDGRRSGLLGVGPLRNPRFGTLLLVAAGVAFSFGASPVAVAAFADEYSAQNSSTVTGVLIAVWSLGSAAGGLLYGTLVPPNHSPATLSRRTTALTVLLAFGYAVWLLAPSVVILGVLMVLTGAVIAPTTAVLAESVAVTVDDAELTEAYTWFTAVNMSLAAAGAAIGGHLADVPDGGVAAAIGSCAAAVAVAAAVALLTTRGSSAARMARTGADR
ncbi:MFS transporter [Mycolicibacterium neoaurum]|uniref:MFS transporter n=1 Tax=Mycolicibacterium neoaurum TaxID=1795 RepID=UPI002673624D|nr:MFS transporter [Mycolicibacterium neoaurum]MDO3399919.1 MFS transporter [Mycolicibacterium neoaurum]